jgi:hypothetical protein
LLLAAAVLVVVGTVTELIDAINTHQNAVNTGVVVLDRVLLTLIVAELLQTLRSSSSVARSWWSPSCSSV